MTCWSILLPEQPVDVDNIFAFAEIVANGPLQRVWAGQSFNIESHMALAALRGHRAVPVGIGTALAALRTPYDAAMQARSLALLLKSEVSIAYGAADPDFVRRITGSALEKPATYTAEYARLVRALLDSKPAKSDVDRVEMEAEMGPVPLHAPIRVGTGVLRAGMAERSKDHVDFVVTWLTPTSYLQRVLVPALERADGTRPAISTFVACAVKRPGRDPYLLVQRGCPHLRRHHYVDMLQKADLDVHASDPVSGARELVVNGVFVYGTVAEVVDQLMVYFAVGVDEVVLNLTPVNLLLGLTEALLDASEISEELSKRSVAA